MKYISLAKVSNALVNENKELALEELAKINREVYQYLKDDLFCILDLRIDIENQLQKEFFWFIHENLFSPIVQSISGNLIAEVKAASLINSSSNYRKTKGGFNYHTDGIYKPNGSPEYIVLACLEQAEVGGDSFLIDVQSILAELALKENFFKILTNDIFCVKSEWDKNEKVILRKKILDLNSDETLKTINYFRAEIENGHILANIPLKQEQIDALNFLDMTFFKHISDNRFRLKTGQMLIVNNHNMIHGRMPFKEINQKRHLLRMWGSPKSV